MFTIDLADKISLFDLLKAIIVPVSICEIEQLLKAKKIVKEKQRLIFFNWGRNALFALFKRLPYKTIHFPAFTCSVTTDAAIFAGKKVELIDVDEETFNLDIQKLRNRKIECLVVLHTFGNPIDVARIKKILPDTYIIEDCAHALFSKIKGDYVGKIGDTALFSLYKQTPNINGAILATKQLILEQKEEPLPSLIKRILIKIKGPHENLLNKQKKTYLPVVVKYPFRENLRPNRAVLNLFKKSFKKLKEEIKERRELSNTYFSLCNKSEYFLSQKPEKKGKHSFYQFVIRLKPKYLKLRDRILKDLRKREIFLDRLWYDTPIAQKKFANFKKSCPKALLLSKSVISLPIRSELKKEKVVFLFNQLERMVKENL